MYDLIEAQVRGGTLYFHKIIESSGRNVIQMKIFNGQQTKAVAKVLEQFGCKWRHNEDNLLIAFDVPKYMPYNFIKIWLHQGEKEERWGYREACLSHE